MCQMTYLGALRAPRATGTRSWDREINGRMREGYAGRKAGAGAMKRRLCRRESRIGPPQYSQPSLSQRVSVGRY